MRRTTYRGAMTLARCAALLVCLSVALPSEAQPDQSNSGTTSIRLGAGRVRAGERVRAEGRTTDAGLMRVERLRAKDADGSVRIEGQITEIDHELSTVTLMEFTVTVTSTTRILDGDQALPGLAALRAGDRVEVRGVIDAERTVTADRLRRSPVVGNPRDELEAPIDRVIDQDTFELLGRRMVLVLGVSFIDDRQGASKIGQLRRDDDEQQVDGIRLGSWGVIGGRLQGTYSTISNAALDRTSVRDTEVRSAAQVVGVADLGPKAQVYAKVEVGRSHALGSTQAPLRDLRVKEANARLHIVGPVELQAGRVRLRDAFEWFADDYLDAARIVVSADQTRVEFGGSYGFRVPNGRSRSDERQVFATITHEFNRSLVVSSFFLGRDDRTRRERPMWLFVETSGRGSQFRYWGNVAARGGRSQNEVLRGWAFDGGGALRTRGGLWLTASVARGSGDADRSDRVDRTFRQTGLEDTQTRLAGFKRIHSYGELMQPDLSNLRVFTFGLGWQGAAASFDAVLHRYRQDVPYRTPADTALLIRPTGMDGLLGHEVDGVLTFRLRTGVDLTVTGGTYVPGPAQVRPHRPAFLLKSELLYFF
ncbi:MAG: hypothetical protein HOP16_07750 [Acidobacteria bacterium]|nr:hypothetical protein [Acidobacteriota bacterium]